MGWGVGGVQQSPKDLLPYTFGDLWPFVREWISGILFKAHGVLLGQHRLREKLVWLKVKLQCKALQQQSKAETFHIFANQFKVFLCHTGLFHYVLLYFNVLLYTFYMVEHVISTCILYTALLVVCTTIFLL